MSQLLSRGYTLVPEPQQVSLSGGDFEFNLQWHYKVGPGVKADSPAVRSLHESLKERFDLTMSERTQGPELLLTSKPGSVQPGTSQDPDRNAIDAQAYRLALSPTSIEISANSETGLFYGVQTLVQLLREKNGKLFLPAAEIVDWPDLRLRAMYWDDAHHLEHLADLKTAVRQASFYKINGFALKLEGHFQFQSAPTIVEPQALSPAQLQELTDYGLQYHVEVIPYLDAPAHIAFILKHREFTKLRQFPDSNYESCVTNPDTLKLFYGLFDDLLAANRGTHYVYLSTDEAYYVGMANLPSCNEAQRQGELGSAGKVLAEFVGKVAGHLHEAGREVIFWGELPLKPGDLPSLPPYLINGETYGPKFDSLYKAQGIRQMIYQSTEGEERLFPQYSLLPAARLTQPLHENATRVRDAVSQIAAEPARKTSDIIGLTVAGWADMGLHPETFWLGYATISAAGWRPWTISANDAAKAFYPLFYGPKIANMDRIYELMSYQAQIWTNTWENVKSPLRKTIWGDSEKIFRPGKPAHDQTIPLPGMLSEQLGYKSAWAVSNAARLASAKQALLENDELNTLLLQNRRSADFNRYNLEIFQSLAGLCRQNLELLLGLERIDNSLTQASIASQAADAGKAVRLVDKALVEVRQIRDRRNQALQEALTSWYKSWRPRVREGNGRVFVHELDDVKDHLPDRTVDMSYLIYRDLNLPFEEWYRATLHTRNEYATSHKLPVNNTQLNWRQHP